MWSAQPQVNFSFLNNFGKDLIWSFFEQPKSHLGWLLLNCRIPWLWASALENTMLPHARTVESESVPLPNDSTVPLLRGGPL